MEFREGNEHLVDIPIGLEIGDLVQVERYVDSPTGPKLTKWLGTIEDIVVDSGQEPHYGILPVGADDILVIEAAHITLITRPLDVTNISDEDIETHIARLHDLTYRPVMKKKKAKTSSVKSPKPKSLESQARTAVKTGKVSGMDLDALLAAAEKVTKKESTS